MSCNSWLLPNELRVFVVALSLVTVGYGCGKNEGTGEVGGGPGGSQTGGTGSGSDPCSGNGGPAAAADMVTFEQNVTVTTVAGSAAYGTTDGPATAATFENPVGVLIEPEGSVLVADYDSNTIRRVGADGNVSTVTKHPGFAQPFGLAFGKSAHLYATTDFTPPRIKNTK